MLLLEHLYTTFVIKMDVPLFLMVIIVSGQVGLDHILQINFLYSVDLEREEQLGIKEKLLILTSPPFPLLKEMGALHGCDE